MLACLHFPLDLGNVFFEPTDVLIFDPDLGLEMRDVILKLSDMLAPQTQLHLELGLRLLQRIFFCAEPDDLAIAYDELSVSLHEPLMQIVLPACKQGKAC